MSKKIVYTNHAEDALQKRMISKEMIQNALNNPSKKIKKNNIKIIHKYFDDKILRIVYVKNNESYKIITAYLTYKARYIGEEKDENKI